MFENNVMGIGNYKKLKEEKCNLILKIWIKISKNYSETLIIFKSLLNYSISTKNW